MTSSPLRSASRWFTSAIVSIFTLGPIVLLVATSLSSPKTLSGGALNSGALTLKNYETLANRLHLSSIFADSFALASTTALLTSVLGVGVSYFSSRSRDKFAPQVFLASLSVWLVPPIALSLQVYLWFKEIRLFDSLPGLVLLYTAIFGSLVVVLLTPYFDSLPLRRDESAWVDGNEGYTSLLVAHRGVILPMAVGLLVFVFTLAWNELLFASILTDRRITPVPVALLGLTSGSHIAWGDLAALATLAVIPALVAAPTIWWVARLLSKRRTLWS